MEEFRPGNIVKCAKPLPDFGISVGDYFIVVEGGRKIDSAQIALIPFDFEKGNRMWLQQACDKYPCRKVSFIDDEEAVLAFFPFKSRMGVFFVHVSALELAIIKMNAKKERESIWARTRRVVKTRFA